MGMCGYVGTVCLTGFWEVGDCSRTYIPWEEFVSGYPEAPKNTPTAAMNPPLVLEMSIIQEHSRPHG